MNLSPSTSIPTPPTGRFSGGLLVLNALLCAAVAGVSYRYFFTDGVTPENIAGNAFRHPWLLVHVAGAATALLLGPIQLFPGLRAHHRTLHRIVGRVYVAGCVIGGVSGFVLALGNTTGTATSLGFGALAAAWLFSTVLAWRRAVQGRIADHRAWTVRSFSLTLAAVTLRLYLPLAEVMSWPEAGSYTAISFLCWLPNLAVAEWYLRSGGAQQRPAGQA